MARLQERQGVPAGGREAVPLHLDVPGRPTPRELSPAPLLVGTVLGLVFGASSLYLVLKVGLTVSASIPVAVISITLFRILSRLGLRDASILQHNIVQTAGSAGESIAFGIGVTMPAIMILGFDLEAGRVVLVAVLGGLLGILMMIPLRRALIVRQHGILKYPEGTACAEVLKAGAAAAPAGSPGAPRNLEAGARIVGAGFGLGLAYKTAMSALKGWKDIPQRVFGSPFEGGSVAAEVSPELLGVGYIIGPRIAATMCAGGVLASLVLIPAIRFFGAGLPRPLPPGTVPIGSMGPGDIRDAYVLYIGAGAVAAGGIVSVLRSLPLITRSLLEGLAEVRPRAGAAAAPVRTDRDLPAPLVAAGMVLLLVALTLASPLHLNPLGALLILVFGFLFVTVSSRLTGEIGSSSNPISGMTVATLLLTCLIFLVIGWTGPGHYVTALSVGAVVCIAASNGGTTSQDLKTGFLVGATPRAQQIAILIGSLASALVLGPVLIRLNEAATVYVPQMELVAPGPAAPPAPQVWADLPVYRGPGVPPGGEGGELKVWNSGPGEAGGVTYLVDAAGRVRWRVVENFPAHLRAPAGRISSAREELRGPQRTADPASYRVWHNTDEAGGLAGRYLLDDAGRPVYRVDPGINGTREVRPDGTRVGKFDAPKATLMSYIIKGILNGELPWGLVLLGVMTALVLELASIPSLAFAVGVYLPLSASSPILIGGLVRAGVDAYLRAKHDHARLTAEQLAAEGDRSPGVLLASGYIAGGAIGGIIIAFMAGFVAQADRALLDWSGAHNPFFGGPYADLLSLLPFLLLAAILYLTGRERLLRPGARAVGGP